MKLYSRPLSPYSARVRIALYAKGLEADIVVPEMGWSKDPKFLEVNPLGRIPVLVLDDGTTLVESAAIVDYIDEAYPTPPLRPGSPTERAQLRAFSQIVEQDVLETMMKVFGQIYMKEDASEAKAKLRTGLGHVERMLEERKDITIVDTILLPARFSLGSLEKYADLPTLLEPFPKIARYREKATTLPALARVWHEMEEGFIAFMAFLAKQKPPA